MAYDQGRLGRREGAHLAKHGLWFDLGGTPYDGRRTHVRHRRTTVIASIVSEAPKLTRVALVSHVTLEVHLCADHKSVTADRLAQVLGLSYDVTHLARPPRLLDLRQSGGEQKF